MIGLDYSVVDIDGIKFRGRLLDDLGAMSKHEHFSLALDGSGDDLSGYHGLAGTGGTHEKDPAVARRKAAASLLDCVDLVRARLKTHAATSSWSSSCIATFERKRSSSSIRAAPVQTSRKGQFPQRLRHEFEFLGKKPKRRE